MVAIRALIAPFALEDVAAIHAVFAMEREITAEKRL
jgi:hypothetical protein